MGFQMQICSTLCFFWSILVKCCVHLQRSSSKTQMLLLERNIFHKINIDCFVIDSSHLLLTFVAFCLLSVIHKQSLKQCNYSIIQSALMTRFQTDFTSSVWNFCCVPSRKTFLAVSGARKNGCFCRLGFRVFCLKLVIGLHYSKFSALTKVSV